jgi:hypothetical protein
LTEKPMPLFLLEFISIAQQCTRDRVRRSGHRPPTFLEHDAIRQ